MSKRIITISREFGSGGRLYQIDESAAMKMIQDVDKRRSMNYSFYTEQKWGMASNYTLSLNSSELGYEMCEKMIIDCVKE